MERDNTIIQVKQENIVNSIRELAVKILPQNSQAILFGSQARGDANIDSDYDVLIILDKDKIEQSDYDKYSYPLFELGWSINKQIHPILYSAKSWKERFFSPLYKNIEKEGIALC